MRVCLSFVMCLFTVVPVAASVSADETEALKAEITKAVEKVQEAGKTARNSLYRKLKHLYFNSIISLEKHTNNCVRNGT